MSPPELNVEVCSSAATLLGGNSVSLLSIASYRIFICSYYNYNLSPKLKFLNPKVTKSSVATGCHIGECMVLSSVACSNLRVLASWQGGMSLAYASDLTRNDRCLVDESLSEFILDHSSQQ